MAQPKVSVVMCTYNGAAFLQEQLESILQQTYPLHELIIVDDGSTDGTIEILQQAAAQHPIICWQQNEINLGYNKNFEKALSLATGDVIAIADQDDVWHLQKIELLLQHWPEESPLIYSDSSLFEDEVPKQPKSNPFMNRVWGADPRKLALYNTISGHAAMIRRSLLELALPFNPDVYYDWWLAVVAMANGGVTYVPQILVYQREHHDNASKPIPDRSRRLLLRERKWFKANLTQFVKTPNLSKEHHLFFQELLELWIAVMEGSSRYLLFSFLMKHRNTIYKSKRRKLGVFSDLKRSFKYAFGAVEKK